MEQRKTWEEYSNEEKTTLLNHWVYYYGGIIMIYDYDGETILPINELIFYIIRLVF